MIKKTIITALITAMSALASYAQPLALGLVKDREAVVAEIDSNTLKLRNKLYPYVFPGDLNVHGFNEEDIPVYSDSAYAYRLTLLETEIPLEYNQQVRAYIDLYANRKRKLVSKVLSTSKFYFPIFEEVFDRENVPMEFKYLAVIESALNQEAMSPVGAAGLWQFMAPTGRMYGLRTDNYIDDRKDIVKSTEAAVKYFKNSYRLYGDWMLVIASYNCGPGNVSKAIRKSGGKRNIWDIMPYLPRETRGYVPAFIAAAYIMNYAAEHNLYPADEFQPYYHLDTVIVDNTMSIDQLAIALNTTAEEIKFYNPSLKRGIIPFSAKGIVLTLPYHQAVMVGKLRTDSSFNQQVNNELIALNREVSRNNHPKINYKVKPGDQLAKIARKYDVSVAELKQWNKGKIKNNKVVKGQKLVIYPNRA